MASWYSRFSKKMFMALASAGKYQTVCDCEVHPNWRPGQEYIADSLVTHINPKTSELSLFRARGVKSENQYVDASGDEPGESIHWELICTCDEIGFTPTPVNTPTPDEVTPTPTLKYSIQTPTPTPKFRCEDYTEWDGDKILQPGAPHYAFKDRVFYKGKVYEVRDLHGTEKNDVPGVSNHWSYLFDCAECVCVPSHFETWEVSENESKFETGYTQGFAKNLSVHFDPTEFADGPGVKLEIALDNSNIRGDIFIENKKIPFEGVNLYVTFNGICYHNHVKSLNGNTSFTLDIISFPEICPTPSPDSAYVCGEEFPNAYTTDGKSGSHDPYHGLSAELFESGGKVYYSDLQITNLNEASVYTSVLYKNEISDSPFGILVLVGKFPTGKNYIVYESPDGSCWRANIQPNGKNIVMFRVL